MPNEAGFGRTDIDGDECLCELELRFCPLEAGEFFLW